MGATGFKCPQCGRDDDFVADQAILYNASVHVTPDGWDVTWGGFDIELTDRASMRCLSCGHVGRADEFGE